MEHFYVSNKYFLCQFKNVDSDIFTSFVLKNMKNKNRPSNCQEGNHLKANLPAQEHCKCRWTEGLKLNIIASVLDIPIKERSWQCREKWHETTTTSSA